MYYVSTRNKKLRMSALEAIAQGLAADGGLLTPEVLPKLAHNAIETMKDMSYQQRAVYVMSVFLEEFSASELFHFANKAYGPDKFDTHEVAPLRQVDENTWSLELWHGPTSAFKDMALQMLPHLLTASLVKTEENKTACILVATSGDTGKAALEGFRDVDHTRILVFYPQNGVSDIQELQMKTRRETTWAYAPWPGISPMPRPESRSGFPTRLCAKSWRGGGISSPPPIPSTGAGCCPRSSIIFPLTATWCGTAKSRTGIGSTYACPQAISGTSFPLTSQSGWECRSTA
jgi:hypothetical protein